LCEGIAGQARRSALPLGFAKNDRSFRGREDGKKQRRSRCFFPSLYKSTQSHSERSEESPRHYSLFDFFNCSLEMTGVCRGWEVGAAAQPPLPLPTSLYYDVIVFLCGKKKMLIRENSWTKKPISKIFLIFAPNK